MGLPFVAIALVIGLWALSRMGRMTVPQVRRFQKQLLGAALAVAALLFITHGNLFLGLPALAASAGLLGWAHLLPQGLGAASPRAASAPPPVSTRAGRRRWSIGSRR